MPKIQVKMQCETLLQRATSFPFYLYSRLSRFSCSEQLVSTTSNRFSLWSWWFSVSERVLDALQEPLFPLLLFFHRLATVVDGTVTVTLVTCVVLVSIAGFVFTFDVIFILIVIILVAFGHLWNSISMNVVVIVASCTVFIDDIVRRVVLVDVA